MKYVAVSQQPLLVLSGLNTHGEKLHGELLRHRLDEKEAKEHLPEGTAGLAQKRRGWLHRSIMCVMNWCQEKERGHGQ